MGRRCELHMLLAASTVLFTFLLTVPFSARFAAADTLKVVTYFVAFLCTALAIVLFVGETAYHRVGGRSYDKKRLVTTASRQAIGGIALMAVTLAAVVFLVADVLFPIPAAVGAAAAVLTSTVSVWFALPLLRRYRRGGSRD